MTHQTTYREDSITAILKSLCSPTQYPPFPNPSETIIKNYMIITVMISLNCHH